MIKKVESIRPSFYHFSIQYRLDPDVIPVGMRENLLLIGDPEAELKGANYLHLNLYHPAQDNEPDRAFLTVSYLLDAEKVQQSAEDFSRLHEEITEKLRKLLPFSDGKIQLTFPLQNGEPKDDGTLFPMEKPDFDIFRENARTNPVYQVSPNKFGGLFPTGNLTPYKNLYLTSPEILAALGFEGKFLLGLKTIDLIWSEAENSQKKAIRQRKIA